ncbi:MAG TPA: alpha/beta fold hydrolase [Solirubrobacterales bacterium]|nr:alpha/beta fold hydrolase [Solirubrobacterales bacterium]
MTDGNPTKLETLVFRAAVAFIALHVADDNFLQPNPGTSAADHLAGGLVPLGLLLGLALVYPRLKTVARGGVALVTGLFGVATGLEGYHYLREVGASGDDHTGLVAAPAAAALLPLAAIVLWRGRRTDGGLGRRYGRRLLIGAGGVLAVGFVVVPMLFGYAFTHLARGKVPAPALGTAHKDVSFTTSDGLELEGWYIPSRNGAAVIAFPGRKNPQGRARFLARHGYGVLLFDRRGEGASDGDPNSYGWDGDRDVKAAIRWLRQRRDVDPDRIGGIGLSVGGEMLLETAAETPLLRAVISEGAGSRSFREARHIMGADVASFLPMAAAVTVFSGHTPAPDLRALVARIEQPTLLIHGRYSQKGTEAKYNKIYDEAGGPNVTRWEIPKSGHTGGLDAAPAEYERRVVRFFDHALDPE